MTYYYVCDKCGNLANITDEPLTGDPKWVCDKCQSDNLWQFTDEEKALAHSRLIHERFLRVGAR